jgi:hypothetical protein
MTKVHPIKLPSYSGDTSKDFFAFKDTFHKTTADNRISRRDQLEKLRECLAGRDATNLPLNGLKDIEEAWQFIQEAFGNLYASLQYNYLEAPLHHE